MTKIKKIVILLVITTCGLLGWGISGWFSKPSPPLPVENRSCISAVTLYQEYKANEIAADKKYKDKTLEIYGTIEEIGKNPVNRLYIMLKDAKTTNSLIQCFFTDEHEDELAKLTKGQPVTVKGTCTGKHGYIHIEQCILVKK